MLFSLVLTTAMTWAQTPIQESKQPLPEPAESSVPSTPYKFKHYSETLYVDQMKGLNTLLRHRLEKKLDYRTPIPLIAYAGVLTDRNLMVTEGKKISSNSDSPHLGLKSELISDVWTWAEYRRKYVHATEAGPGRNFDDARLGICYDTVFPALYSNWLMSEMLFELVQIQRLSMDLYSDGYLRIYPRWQISEKVNLDLYSEFNFQYFPTPAVETRNQMRYGLRAGFKFERLVISSLFYQLTQEIRPVTYEDRGMQMMTYISAAL